MARGMTYMKAVLTIATDAVCRRTRLPLLQGAARVLLCASLTFSLLAVGANPAAGQVQPSPPTKATPRARPAAVAAAAATTTQIIVSAGPLNSIFLGADLSAQVAHTGDTAFESFPSGSSPADNGTLLVVNN